jgi:hypothetical protein
MLSLTIAMFHEFFALTAMFLLAVPGLSAQAQGDTPVVTPNNIIQTPIPGILTTTPVPETETLPVIIQSPSPGDAIQGVITIMGSIVAEDFQHGELSFSYVQNPTSTWFLIKTIEEPNENGIISEWDTTTITDGTYNLRLSVIYADGNEVVIEIRDLRVRNYTPIETNTPVPGSSPAPTETPIPPTATALPGNPAELAPQDVAGGFAKGILVTIGIFSLFGLYVVVRNRITNR